jgi:hypothetical protein
MTEVIPEPVKGGTYFYCRHSVRCEATHWHTKSLRKYRRHWRRQHAN